MELKNIFKMEMFKNRNDKPYLLVIAILTAMAAAASIMGIMINKTAIFDSPLSSFEITLTAFTVIGLFAFLLLYPFHLLNVDYKNKVISLIFASGVSREKYYFVKIGATILSSLIAVFIILLIPMVIFLIVYPNDFVQAIQDIFKNFNLQDIMPFVLYCVTSLVANIVMLTTAVIITKGKPSGIFLYFAFMFIVSIVGKTIIPTPTLITLSNNDSFSNHLYISAIIAIVEIAVFGFIGLRVLSKQDL